VAVAVTCPGGRVLAWTSWRLWAVWREMAT